MSLNVEKIGRPLAVIEGKGYLKGKQIWVATGSDKPKEGFPRLELPDEFHFQQIPNTKSEREILYLTGASGSGKSTYIRKYCEQFKKAYPDRPIYLFSSLKEDESLDEIKPKRVKMDEDIYKNPIKPEDLQESLVIFDDQDCIGDKKIRNAVVELANQVLEIGRHFKISACYVSHLPTDKGNTRRILNEAHSIIYFPHSGSLRGQRYLLESYVGLDIKDIQAIKKLDTRWCCIFKNFPQVIMTEKMCWLLSAGMAEGDDLETIQRDVKKNK
ncbi:putative packaging ATPase [Dishui Lake virophage 6]|nr:putative packaging ATPase [Dishui Lake virophage 6]